MIYKDWALVIKILIVIIWFLTTTILLPVDTEPFESLFRKDFDYFTIEDGLPENAVRCMEKDNFDNYWICTNGGLVRYDGYEFETITSDHFGNEIPKSGIRDIKIVDNTIYIGTIRGLFKFNLSTGTFENIKLGQSGHLYVNSIKLHGNSLYVGTTQGLYLFSDDKSEIIISNHAIRDFHISSKSLVISSIGRGLVSFSIDNGVISNERMLIELGSVIGTEITLISNKLFVSTHGKGIYVFDSNFNLINHLSACESQNCINSNYIASIERINNELIISTRKGWIRANLSLEKFTYGFPSKYISSQYLSDDVQFVKEFDNHLWIGLHPGGLIRLHKDRLGLSISRINSINKSSSGLGIYAITNFNSTTYVGTYSGLHKLNQNTNSITPLVSVPDNLRINALCVIGEKLIIVSTSSGIYTFDPSISSFNVIEETVTNEFSLSNWCSNELAYFAITGGIGMFQVNKEVKFQNLDMFNTDNKIIKIKKIDEYIYIGSDYDLYRFKINSSGELAFNKKYNLDRKVFDIEANKDKIYVIADTDLLSIDKYSSNIRRLRLTDKYSSIKPYALQQIGENLWVSTNNGILKINDNQVIKHFIKTHGLGDKEFNAGSFLYDEHTNTIYAGGLTSLTSIRLNEFNLRARKNNLITKIMISSDKGKTVNKIYNNPEKLTINEGHSLHLYLGHLDSVSRSDTSFYYQITSVFDDLVNILSPDERRISIVNIGSNDFTVHMPFSDYSIEIQVIPYLWKRWWAILIYLYIFLLLTYFIFKHYRTTRETRHTKEILQNQLDSKRQQLASLSHELRTPLNSIIGILNEPNLNNKNKQYLKSSSILLRSLIDNILNSASNEVGQEIDILKEQISIRTLIKQCLHVMSPYLKSANIIVSYEIDKSVPNDIETDGVKVQQVLLNIIKNSIKHGKSVSKIHIQIERRANQMFVCVTDNGIGVSINPANDIFDAFYKDKSSSGFGLGLHISKVICQALGGDLTLDEEHSNGARFLVSFEFNDTLNKLRVIPESNIQIRGEAKALLVLEDDPLNAYAIKLLLNRISHDNYKVANCLTDFETKFSQILEVLILDLNFGADINGLKLAYRLRQNGFKGEIYIYSADSTVSSIMSEYFVTGSILKPISIRELERITFNWS